MGRYWEFRDDDGLVHTVPRNSPGVVGQQPTLAPGSCFEYHSRVQINTEEGTMKGSFQMVDLSDEREFDALIDTTALSSAAGAWVSWNNVVFPA